MTPPRPNPFAAPTSPPARSAWVPIALVVAGLVAVFASGVTTSPWSCLPDPAMAGDLVLLALLGAAFFPARVPSAATIGACLFGAIAIVFATFLATLDGGLLFTDDHSTFFYRLHVLAAAFPDLLYYEPGWNAGRLTTEVFPTGAILLYLLAAPLLAFLPLESAYPIVVGLVIYGLCPLLVVLAARVLGLGARTAWVAGFFALLPSLLLTRWGLKYGAVPCVVVTHAAPLVYALAHRVAVDERRWLFAAAALVVVLSLALLWSGAVFLLAPVGGLAFLDLRARARGRLRLVAVAIVVAAANAWWILEYVRHVPVFEFVSNADALHDAPLESRGGVALGPSLHALLAAAQKTNPFFLALLPVAAFARRHRAQVVRLVLLATVFLAVTVVGPQVARHLELDRLSLAMSLCLAIVAAVGTAELWRASTPGRPEGMLGRGLTVAMLLVTLLGARVYAMNDAVERFGALAPEVEELVARIRAESGGGRTYVAGFVLHDFSDGHAAALQPLTGVEMVAVEPSHRYWGFRSPLPPQFRDRWESIHRYFWLLNVDLVVTKDRAWRLGFEADPAVDKLWQGGRYALFRFRDTPASWVMEGEGTVEAGPNRLRIAAESERVVLRYRYVPGLRASGDAVVEAVEIDGLDWIGVRGAAGRTVEVFYP